MTALRYPFLLMLVAALSMSTNAWGNFHVSAYADAAGFAKIEAKDYQAAAFQSESAGRLSGDYAASANACVSQLLLDELDQALTSCQKALRRLPRSNSYADFSARRQQHEMESLLLSNRGVVLARQGKTVRAERDFTRALVLDAMNSNAQQNLQYLRATQLGAVTK